MILPSPALATLDSVFSRLRASPRFPLLARVPAANFVASSPWNQALSQVTLDELTTLPASELAEMANATSEQIQSLIDAFLHLCEAPAPATEATPGGGLYGRNILSIAGTEMQIKEAVQRFKEAQPSESLLSKRLEEFWPKDAPPSPFESSITLKAFLTLDHEALIKKRSMTTEKVNAILASLETATAEAKRSSSQTSPPVTFASMIRSVRGESLPVASSLATQARRDPVSSIMPSITSDSAMHRTTALLLLAARQLPALQDLFLSTSPEFVTSLWNTDSVESFLLQCSKKELQQCLTWASAHFGPEPTAIGTAFRREHLITQVPAEYGRDDVLNAIIHRLIDFVLVCREYRHPIVDGKPVSELWSKEPRALEKLVKAFRETKNKAEGTALLLSAVSSLGNTLAESLIAAKKSKRTASSKQRRKR